MKHAFLHFRGRALHIAAFLSIFLLATTQLQKPVRAQSADTGALFGTVTDKSGAVVPDASVIVANSATKAKKTVNSNLTGFYSVESLQAGDYKVTVTKQGFATTDVNNIHIDPGQRREVSLGLTVGAATEIVSVEANPLQVKTETSEVSSTIDANEIKTLLVNGRNFQSLATLVPGVNNTTGNSQYSGGGLTSSTTISIGGTGVDNTTYLVDGVYNMNTGNYVNINITPSMDAISEFTVLKSNYSSRYGTSSSGVIMVNTKSGSTEYHGAAWDYLRNDAVDASTYYSQGKKSELRQNTYGFALGGPLQIPKFYNWDRKKQTFFFASDEWWQIPGFGFFGNAQHGIIRGPKEVAFNAELNKTFDIVERLNFQFQAQVFNIANHPSFSNMHTGIGPNEPNPGLVSSPSDQRIMQVVGRFNF